LNVKIDPETVERFKAGEDEAFSRIFRTCAPALFGTALRILGDRGLSEDVVQEAFVRLYRMRSRLRPDKSIAALLARITANLAIDLLRRRKRERWEALETEVADPKAAARPIDARIGTVEAINRAAGTLSPIYRTVLVLRYAHELAYEEIADTLKISVPAVALRLKRGKEQLRAALAQQP
jgi:RNA polymerase sigma-70 factor (ECF subfamily)